MKFKSATILIALVALLSVAASGCSSLGVALDTSIGIESYGVGFDHQELEEQDRKNNYGIQVIPKIVSSQNYDVLLPLSNRNSSFGMGIDYDIIYLGYNTPQLIDDVILKRKSPSSALEEPNIKSENNFQMFMIIPSLVLQFDFRFSGESLSKKYNGFGILYAEDDSITPYYDTITYENKRFKMSSIKGFTGATAVNFDGGSFFFKFISATIEGATESDDDRINIDYSSLVLGLRSYL